MLFEFQTVDIASSVSMGADFTSAKIDVWGFDYGGIQYIWSGANATNAKIVPQMSGNGVDFCDWLPEANANRIDEASGCGMYDIAAYPFQWLRIRFIANSNTTGTITVTSYAKRQRISS